MKLLVQSAMVFFGTLMAAGLVALGEPGSEALSVAANVSVQENHRAQREGGTDLHWHEAAPQAAFGPR